MTENWVRYGGAWWEHWYCFTQGGRSSLPRGSAYSLSGDTKIVRERTVIGFSRAVEAQQWGEAQWTAKDLV